MLLNYFQKLDDIFSYLLGNYLNEKKFLQKKIKKNIIFIDIGANVGTFSEFIKNNFSYLIILNKFIIKLLNLILAKILNR